MITFAQSRHNRTIIAAMRILFIGGTVGLFFQNASAQNTQLYREDALSRPAAQTRSIQSATHLYFADRDNYYLMSEQRSVTHTGDPVDYARSIVEALIKGPQNSLVNTLATDTKLRAIYLIPGGDCYVDLSQAAGKDHTGGCNSELLTIYSVVNSLILNVPEIKRVKLLVEGKEVQTLAGHIDLELLEANMLLIR